jgi:CHAD domain-containing protein
MTSNTLKSLETGSPAEKDSANAIILSSKEPVAHPKPLPDSPHPVKTAAWFSRILRRRLDVFLHRLNQCRKKPLAEPVHDLRVATRRLISLIKLLGQIFPDCKTRKTLGILKKQFESLGELRDANILRIAIERQQKSFPDLVVLTRQLRRRERRLVKSASREIKRCKKHKVARCVDKLIADLRETPGNIRWQKKLNSIALRCAREAFAETQKRRKLIDYSDLATIHRTRIAFKKFRYIVECLPPEMTGLGKRELGALNLYQGRMGVIQDLVVIQSHLEDFTKQKKETTAKFGSFFRHLRHRRALALRGFRKSADTLLQFQPPS